MTARVGDISTEAESGDTIRLSEHFSTPCDVMLSLKRMDVVEYHGERGESESESQSQSDR